MPYRLFWRISVFPLQAILAGPILLFSIYVLKEAVIPRGVAGILLVALSSDTINMQRLSIVFAVLLGGYALKEKHQRMRLASASIIFLGTFLIAFG